MESLAHKSRYACAGRPELALTGGLAAGVPLELRGLELAHSRHGVLPWNHVVEPAADIAERGFPAHPYLVSVLEFSNFTVSCYSG